MVFLANFLSTFRARKMVGLLELEKFARQIELVRLSVVCPSSRVPDQMGFARYTSRQKLLHVELGPIIEKQLLAALRPEIMQQSNESED